MLRKLASFVVLLFSLTYGSPTSSENLNSIQEVYLAVVGNASDPGQQKLINSLLSDIKRALRGKFVTASPVWEHRSDWSAERATETVPKNYTHYVIARISNEDESTEGEVAKLRLEIGRFEWNSSGRVLAFSGTWPASGADDHTVTVARADADRGRSTPSFIVYFPQLSQWEMRGNKAILDRLMSWIRLAMPELKTSISFKINCIDNKKEWMVTDLIGSPLPFSELSLHFGARLAKKLQEAQFLPPWQLHDKRIANPVEWKTVCSAENRGLDVELETPPHIVVGGQIADVNTDLATGPMKISRTKIKLIVEEVAKRYSFDAVEPPDDSSAQFILYRNELMNAGRAATSHEISDICVDNLKSLTNDDSLLAALTRLIRMNVYNIGRRDTNIAWSCGPRT